MTSLLAVAATAAGVAILLLAALWWRSRAESARLKRRLRSSASELQGLQLAFSRFAPDPVVERVIAEGVTSRGEKMEVTALFADLVGFTSLAEKLPPDALLRILNGYFERMTEAIRDHRGHVATLIGDGMLAIFGALEPNPWQTHDAARAALAMRRELAAYNARLRARELPELAIGVGLHRDLGVGGLVGSADRMEFAVVGRTVTLASRVQALTRDHRCDIIVTGAVAAHLDSRFALRELPPASVKGVDAAVRTYALDDFQELPPGGSS